MTKARRFRQLLSGDDIILSPGVYDGYSARLVEAAGFLTACSTGAGLANSRLGVPDVGIMGLTDNLEAVRMLARTISLPLMADADNGYGNAVTVFHVTRLFEEAGVVGINLEDQVIPKRCGHMAGKEVVDAREMAKKIEAACDARRDDDFVILARTDAIALEGLDAAIARAQLYVKAGADMIFADAIRSDDEIRRVVEAVPVPVSVNMGLGLRSRPTTPLMSIPRLKALGVKRVTLPRMLPAAAILGMQRTLEAFRSASLSSETRDRDDLMVDVDTIWALMGDADVGRLDSRYAVSDEPDAA